MIEELEKPNYEFDLVSIFFVNINLSDVIFIISV